MYYKYITRGYRIKKDIITTRFILFLYIDTYNYVFLYIILFLFFIGTPNNIKLASKNINNHSRVKTTSVSLDPS